MARSISTYCGEPREVWLLQIPTQFAKHLCALLAEQILGVPPPIATIPGNDARRGCEQTNNKQINDGALI
jgi:hypothetical protein